MWMDEGVSLAAVNKPAQKVAFGDNAFLDNGPSTPKDLNYTYGIQVGVWYPPRAKYLGTATDVPGPHMRGYNVGYYDGHVKWVSFDAPLMQFTQYQAGQPDLRPETEPLSP